MHFKEGAGVFTHMGEEIGKVNRVVLDPFSREVTHIVIQKGVLFREDKVVNVDGVMLTNEDTITLKPGIGNFEDLPPFEAAHYVGVDASEMVRSKGVTRSDAGFMPAFYYYPPFGVYPGYPSAPLPGAKIEIERNIPESAVPLKEGTEVVSADGEKVGSIERVLFDSGTKKISHFLISSGLIFKEKKRVPMSWVDSVGEDRIKLGVGTGQLKKLPDHKD
jgi:uncharacterized protein YrrD